MSRTIRMRPIRGPHGTTFVRTTAPEPRDLVGFVMGCALLGGLGLAIGWLFGLTP